MLVYLIKLQKYKEKSILDTWVKMRTPKEKASSAEGGMATSHPAFRENVVSVLDFSRYFKLIIYFFFFYILNQFIKKNNAVEIYCTSL